MKIEVTKRELKAIKFAVELDLDTLNGMRTEQMTFTNRREKRLLIKILEKIEGCE